jgi:hypothetical protein
MTAAASEPTESGENLNHQQLLHPSFFFCVVVNGLCFVLACKEGSDQ